MGIRKKQKLYEIVIKGAPSSMQMPHKDLFSAAKL